MRENTVVICAIAIEQRGIKCVDCLTTQL